MRLRLAGRLPVFVIGALLALPFGAYAQVEATLGGTVTDSTGGVLPGVIVVAVHEATGNVFESVTDGTGVFRMPVRIGPYSITATLPGFTIVTQSGVTVQVGQTATLAMELAPSGLEETITVTGEAPLVNTTNAVMSGNIDARQVADLPIQGRDWTSLALLAPGNRTTEMGDTPIQDRADVREYHLNMDGQQVTQTMGIGGQPLYSRDSIAEFQFVSNRFDATMGRSAGVLVNAITKSGTNNYSGLASGYFRKDSWNAANHVTGVVSPYSNQQVSTTFGGPIVLDKLHFFANFEYEREPKTSLFTTPYPAFNLALEGIRNKKIGGVRTDYQFSPAVRLMLKVHKSADNNPFGRGYSNRHPSSVDSVNRTQSEYLSQLTTVINDRTLNELKVGLAWWNVVQAAGITTWSDHWQKSLLGDKKTGGPQFNFRGFRFAGNSNRPRERQQNMYMFRDDLTTSYEAGGRHDLKVGAEYLYYYEDSQNCRRCSGRFDVRGGSVPSDIESIFPDAYNADTWQIDRLAPITRHLDIGISEDYMTNFPIYRTAAWLQDDWAVTNNLTLNLGLRYDLIANGWANDYELGPWMKKGRGDDTNNIQPRLGFAYSVDDRTVIRGGAGYYYGDIMSNMQLWAMGSATFAVIRIKNDGRSDFLSNPFNGPAPTEAQAWDRFCNVANTPGCLTRGGNELAPPMEYANVTKSLQGGFGVARQLADDMSLEVDYVYSGSRNEKVISGNINLTYDSGTGVNYPFGDRSRRVNPVWGVVSMTPYSGLSDYHGLQTVFTKRFSDNWQFSGNYNLSMLKNADPLPMSGLREVTFSVARDLGDEYTYAATDQRHRAVLNGIWQVGGGFQVSGLYFYGSGERRQTNAGDDLRDTGGDNSERLRPDGTIVPRNAFVGTPIHRIDMRFQQRIPVGGLSVDGMLEVFNLLNHANYGDFDTDMMSQSYGEPDQNNNLAYAARTVQLGFRVTF